MRTIVLRKSGYQPKQTECGIRYYLATLGYLSTWAIEGGQYSYLEISVHSNGDMAAAYWRDLEHLMTPGSKPGYFIMGVLHSDGSYTTHS